LARSLEQLLAAEPLADKQRCLIASLNLSLQRLDADLLAVLPRLGVFQGGAFEFMILEVVEFTQDQWHRLKSSLERTGLIQIEGVVVPFLRFHPTLAPVLWGRLTAGAQGELRLRHQQKYHELVNNMYYEDTRNPHGARFIARQELPNLLWAVKKVLADQSENAANSESLAWYQLGIAYEQNQQLNEANKAYREAVKIDERHGYAVNANTVYGQLANLSERMNQPNEAEDWYVKAIKNSSATGDKLSEFIASYNFAVLLFSQSRLQEAKVLSESALGNGQTIDPAVAKIWELYTLFAMIATTQGDTDAGREYRQLARTAKAAFAGTQFELQQHEPFIAAVVAAVGDKAAESRLESILTQSIENGRGQLVAAIRRVLAGEREVEVLWDDLDLNDSMIIAAILGRV
jgi:tetratricopeptide (TPR) repeat protein